MQIEFGRFEFPESGALVVGVLDERKLTPQAEAADKKTKGALARAMAASRFTGAREQSLEIIAPAGIDASRVVLVGLGKAEGFGALEAEAIGGGIAARLGASGERDVAVAIDAPKGAKIGNAETAARIAYGAQLRSYRFDKYRTK